MMVYRWTVNDLHRGEFVVLARSLEEARRYVINYAEDTSYGWLDFSFLQEEPEIYDPALDPAIITFMIQIG